MDIYTYTRAQGPPPAGGWGAGSDGLPPVCPQFVHIPRAACAFPVRNVTQQDAAAYPDKRTAENGGQRIGGATRATVFHCEW